MKPILFMVILLAGGWRLSGPVQAQEQEPEKKPRAVRPADAQRVVRPRPVQPMTRGRVERLQIPTAVDFDGNEYATVGVGTQWWMAEDLKSDHTARGWPLPTQHSTWAGTFPLHGGTMYHWSLILQDNPPDQIGMSGGLHGSDAVPSGIRGICPEGWHIPSAGEWQILIDRLGGVDAAADALRERLGLENDTYWSATELGGGRVRVVRLYEDNPRVYLMDGSNTSLHRLRCVKD